MSYAAEPYAQFVEDLLLGLTGGVARERFAFVPEARPFRLATSGPIVPDTVRVFGQAGGTYTKFRREVDYKLGPEATIDWQAGDRPVAGAVWPDEGTDFFVSYEAVPDAGALPLLTDRNPGSVTRILAESFAREFAVQSLQLESVYRAGFLDTAERRDLDQVAALVGVVRRGSAFATGSVVFSRSTPAPADIFLPAGTRISSAEPPPTAFETTEDRTLRRGSLSVEAPIRALVAGGAGVAPAGAVRVINRPVLGIEDAANPQATRLGGDDESDEAVRSRARRAFEGSGRGTAGALIAALTAIPGIREKDLRIDEDHLAHPGVVKLTVAVPDLDDARALLAVAAVEEARPVGVRVVHNLNVPAAVGAGGVGPNPFPDEGEAPATVGPASGPADLFMPVDVSVRLLPAALTLTAGDRDDLVRRGRDAVDSFFADAGIGDAMIYNRLVSRLMAIEGVLDVALEMAPQAGGPHARRKNILPAGPTLRPKAGTVVVEVGGSIVALDLVVSVSLKGIGLIGSPDDNREAARSEIAQRLAEGLKSLDTIELTPAVLTNLATGSDKYDVTSLHYTAEYVDAGVRIRRQDVAIALTGMERPWVRSVHLTGEGGAA